MSSLYGLMRYIEDLPNKDIIVEMIKQLVMVKAPIVKVHIKVITENGSEGTNTLYKDGYKHA